MRLSSYYVQHICSPTRTSLLSGRYQIHTGLQDGIIQAWARVCSRQIWIHCRCPEFYWLQDAWLASGMPEFTKTHVYLGVVANPPSTDSSQGPSTITQSCSGLLAATDPISETGPTFAQKRALCKVTASKHRSALRHPATLLRYRATRAVQLHGRMGFCPLDTTCITQL